MASVKKVMSIEARGKGIDENNILDQTIRTEIDGLRFHHRGFQLEDYEIMRDDGSKFILRKLREDVKKHMHRYKIISDYEPDIEKRKELLIYSERDGLNFDIMQKDASYLNVLANHLLSEKRLNDKTNLAEKHGLKNTAYVEFVGEHNNRWSKMANTTDEAVLDFISSAEKMKNLQIYPDTIEKCKMLAIGGHGFANVEGNIQLDNMYASTSIGKIRQNQEDAVALIKHPNIDDFKMMIVADGMGGEENGEIASSLVVEKVKNWFESLSQRDYSDTELLEDKLAIALAKINKEICREVSGGGSTFVGAITCKDRTVIANAGDSRAYKLENEKIVQITDDMSPSYTDWKIGIIEEKDDIRFHKRSSSIDVCMGLDEDFSFQIVSVERNIPIMLCSDGLTDCLSDEEIFVITKKTNIKDLADALVKKALENDSIAREGLNPERYRPIIPAGKDNTTVAIFDPEDER